MVYPTHISMTNDFTFRPGNIHDLVQLRDLALISYSEFSNILTIDNWNKMATNLSDESKIRELINTAKVYVCAHRGQIVGMAYLVPHGNPTNIYPMDWCYIRLLGVHPEYRGLGIAKTLILQCINYAKRNGEKILGLHTSEMMNAARHIYEGLGFKRLKEIDNLFGVKYWLYSLDLLVKTIDGTSEIV